MMMRNNRSMIVTDANGLGDLTQDNLRVMKEIVLVKNKARKTIRMETLNIRR